MAWLTYEGSTLKVKLYNNGAIQEVFSTDKGLSSLEFNDPSRLAWLTKENYRWEVYLAQPVYKSYQFTCTYSNGDWYTGTVYAGAEQGYAAGKKWSRAVENGLTATYEITKVGPQVTAATIGPGDVHVSSYYDAETKHTFTPLNNTKPLGFNYLGSESGFIKNADVGTYQFGLTWLGAGKTAFLEADVGDTYTFKFSYGNGDYYTGRMYADPFDPKYYPGWKSAYTAKNETGKVGNYEITGVSLNHVAGAEYGKVFVTSYYDGDMSKKVFTPFNATSPLGTAYLGSEKNGYINWNNLAPYAFDRYQEADVGDTYLFKYTYGNGDSYTGRVYAPLTGKYYVGRKLSYTTANETGKVGNYLITGLTYSGAAATDYGKVWVDWYYDGDRTKLQYRPANYSKPLGTLYLGSEKGYIKHEGISAYLFSRSYAADSFDTYNFKYTYGNGDYYLGKVYAPPDSAYYPGWKSAYTAKNETGQVGNYQITGQTYSGVAKTEYGKVFVSTYHDGDASKLSFTPVNTATAMGTSLLGSEKGFIKRDTLKSSSASPYYFARYYEADAGDTYTFRYTYSSNPYFYVADSSYQARYTDPKYTNAAGQAVVASSDGHDIEIFLRSNGVTKQLTNNAYDDKNPQINELGQVVWYGYDGHDYEIFLYSNGVTKQLTNNDFDDSADLKINNAGQVVWAAEIGTVGLTPSRVFLYDKGLVKVISYWGKKVQDVRMNDAGQVVWSESDGIEYDVIFYNNGDTRRLSYWDSSALHPDVSINTNPDISAAGRVVWNGDGLSTEGMCIYLEGSGQQQFLYQSYSYFNDQGQLFSGDSKMCFPDSYTGKVYASPKAAYYPGWKSAFTGANENNQVGYYEITGVSFSGLAGMDYGKVFVDSYHDSETNTDVAPAHKGKTVGTNYLASELDYVGGNGAAVARFGKNYYEADVADRYTFRYTYGNGDYYLGLVYAAPGSLYYPGYKFTKTNELGLTGTYEILSMLYSGEKTKYGQVFVTTYYDSETKKSYTPVNAIYPKGTTLLGSETGYIISTSLSAHYFGKGYYEADE